MCKSLDVMFATLRYDRLKIFWICELLVKLVKTKLNISTLVKSPFRKPRISFDK